MKLTRFRSDLILLALAFAWGAAFIAQKTAMAKVGPMTFIGMRFLIVAIVAAPFAVLEWPAARAASPKAWRLIGIAALFFAAGGLIQQVGMTVTTVTNAGFLTTLYVVMIPLAVWGLDRTAPRLTVIAAAIVSFIGLNLLGGGSVSALNWGDFLIIATALMISFNIIFISKVMREAVLPATLALVQAGATAAIALPAALLFEAPSVPAVISAGPELLFTGVIAGGIAFTLQGIAQRHTPPSDAAIIMGSESLWSAMLAYALIGERLSTISLVGAGLIVLAILLVEAGPLFFPERPVRRPAP